MKERIKQVIVKLLSKFLQYEPILEADLKRINNFLLAVEYLKQFGMNINLKNGNSIDLTAIADEATQVRKILGL